MENDAKTSEMNQLQSYALVEIQEFQHRGDLHTHTMHWQSGSAVVTSVTSETATKDQHNQ